MIIDVVTTRAEPTVRNSTIGLGFGYEQETGDEVLFAGDIRYIVDMGIELMRGNTVSASIESWQVLERHPRRDPDGQA